jgi:hypothetical protein
VQGGPRQAAAGQGAVDGIDAEGQCRLGFASGAIFKGGKPGLELLHAGRGWATQTRFVRHGGSTHGGGNQRVAEHSESRLVATWEAVAICVHEMFLAAVTHIERKGGFLGSRRRGIGAGKHR